MSALQAFSNGDSLMWETGWTLPFDVDTHPVTPTHHAFSFTSVFLAHKVSREPEFTLVQSSILKRNWRCVLWQPSRSSWFAPPLTVKIMLYIYLHVGIAKYLEGHSPRTKIGRYDYQLWTRGTRCARQMRYTLSLTSGLQCTTSSETHSNQQYTPARWFNIYCQELVQYTSKTTKLTCTCTV